MYFKFLCRQIVFADRQKQFHFFKIIFRWDGRFEIVSIPSFRDKEPFFLLLDSQLPFRRQLQLPSLKLLNREMVLASGEGLFPDNDDPLLFSMGTKASQSYLFAMPQPDLDNIIDAIGKPEAIMICDEDKEAMTSAISNWYEKGSIYEFNGLHSFFTPTKFLFSVLLLILLVVGGGATLQWLSFVEEQRVRKVEFVEEIKVIADPLLAKRRAISHMLVFFDAKEKLKALSNNKITLMLSIIRDLPQNSYIDAIKQVEDQEWIEVSGWGTNMHEWFLKHKINKSDYQIDKFPKKERFTWKVE